MLLRFCKQASFLLFLAPLLIATASADSSDGDLLPLYEGVELLEDKLRDLERRIEKVEQKLGLLPAPAQVDSESSQTLDDQHLQQVYDRAFSLVQEGNYLEAEVLLIEVAYKATNLDLSSRAFYWLGEISEKNANYPQSLDNFRNSLAKAPKGSTKILSIQLRIAELLAKTGDKSAACKMLGEMKGNPAIKENALIAEKLESFRAATCTSQGLHANETRVRH